MGVRYRCRSAAAQREGSIRAAVPKTQDLPAVNSWVTRVWILSCLPARTVPLGAACLGTVREEGGGEAAVRRSWRAGFSEASVRRKGIGSLEDQSMGSAVCCPVQEGRPCRVLRWDTRSTCEEHSREGVTIQGPGCRLRPPGIHPVPTWPLAARGPCLISDSPGPDTEPVLSYVTCPSGGSLHGDRCA